MAPLFIWKYEFCAILKQFGFSYVQNNAGNKEMDTMNQKETSQTQEFIHAASVWGTYWVGWFFFLVQMCYLTNQHYNHLHQLGLRSAIQRYIVRFKEQQNAQVRIYYFLPNSITEVVRNNSGRDPEEVLSTSVETEVTSQPCSTLFLCSIPGTTVLTHLNFLPNHTIYFAEQGSYLIYHTVYVPGIKVFQTSTLFSLHAVNLVLS